MILRRGIILGLIFLASALIGYGTPPSYRAVVEGICLFLLAYVYAELTRPKGL